MKAIGIVVCVVVLALAGVVFYNVWRGSTDQVAQTPGIVEQGRMDLHTKLVQAEQREAEIEKTYWNSPEQLRVLIDSHKKRMEELNGNSAGAEIVAHDQNAIARLEKRIADIEAEREAETKALAEQAKAEARARKAETLQKPSDQN
jgi:hypothetical protein